MTPAEFKKLWKTKLNKIPRDACEYEIPESTADFLESAGLPDSAAPAAGFGLMGRESVNSVREHFDLDEEDDWNDAVDCPYIGRIADGDPVVLDADGQLWCLRRSNGFEPTFLNSSIEQFAQSLLLYRKLLERQISGESPNALTPWAVAEIASIDAAAMDSEAFWPHYLHSI